VHDVTLAISGMSCGHGGAAVSEALKEVPGVAAAQVAIGSATLQLDPTVASADAAISAAVRAVEDAGYEARLTAGGSGRALPLV
jgi:P-type Cu+ transporter